MTAYVDTKPNSRNVGKTLTLVYSAISYLLFLFTWRNAICSRPMTKTIGAINNTCLCSCLCRKGR